MDTKKPLIRYCANTAKIEVIAPLRWNQDASDSEPGRSTEQSERGPTTIADTQRKTIRQSSALSFVATVVGIEGNI
ncbi:hypothetical protein [Paraburkholderia caffeinitolerans]|uniref:hypothetical protein n=1 Tax=Paraburkholderia caffeinitolerans TaxID=1723730 RepID=UPI0015842D89|nr:hypothetical protein [Paraburkholderia caffeinitolerans]